MISELDCCITKRETWIDVLRGYAILLVVLGHSSPPFMKLIYGFHMPLFFTISGYLWRKRKNGVRYYADKYLRPYFILCFINLLIECIRRRLIGEKPSVVGYVIGILYSRGTQEMMPNCSPLWFLTANFVTLSLFSINNDLKCRAMRAIIGLFFVFVSSMLSIYEVHKLPWNIDTALMAILFVDAGHYLRNNEIRQSNYRVMLGLLALSIGYCCISLNPIEMVNFNNNRYGNVLLMITGALLVSIIHIYCFKKFSHKGLIENYLSWVGKHTLFFMGFDYFVRGLVADIFRGLNINNWFISFVFKTILLSMGCFAWNTLIAMIPIRSARDALEF